MKTSELTGRVFYAGRETCDVFTDSGELTARISGALRHRAASPADLPVVGDEVAIEGGLIRRVLPRRTKFSRRAAGTRQEEQVLAANVDLVFLVCGLDGDFNRRRLERYLVLVRESGAGAVIVLNKSDLRGEDLERVVTDCREISGDAAVIAASTRAPGGLDELSSFVGPGQTIVLLGSSGAGKSSIANRLAGRELLRTQAVREDDSRGRHTTTHRELIRLPGGAFLIDTPGLREIQLWAEQESVESTFDEIATAAARCRFSDCGHKGEPGCAVLAAVEAGTIDEGRWRSFEKLTSEVRQLDKKAIRRMSREMRQYKQKW
jgi:ribosome biogenesis GTPase / thiamine phosphate phosphatase